MITGISNPLVKRIRALGQRKERDEQGVCFVEGIRPVWQAVDSGAGIETIVIAPDLLTSEQAKKMVAQQKASSIQVAEVSARVFERIALRQNPSGLGAIIKTRYRALNELEVPPDSIFVALEETGNPGNLGTVIRTVDAISGSAVILIGEGTDPYNPVAIKASMGAVFNIPIARARNQEELQTWCRAAGIKVFATSPSADSVYWSVSYPRPVLFVFGNEGRGLADEDFTLRSQFVRIPMMGTADSLNLAVSVGVVLYEVKRQEMAKA